MQGTWRSFGLVALLLMLASLATRAMSLVSRTPGSPPADGLLSVIARVTSFCGLDEQITYARATSQDGTGPHVVSMKHPHLLGQVPIGQWAIQPCHDHNENVTRIT